METRSKKRKRQRLMTISSHVSSWPHVPARFESLNDDMLGLILEFVGKKSYKSFGSLNYHCQEIYLTTEGTTKETFLYGYAPLAHIQKRYEKPGYNLSLHKAVGTGVVCYNRRDILEWTFEKQKTYLLSGICDVAAEEGRIDVLDEVWNIVEDWENKDDQKYLFRRVDQCAAGDGKLHVLKWIEDKGFAINKDWCAKVAASHGQIHILEWLQKEQGLLLRAILYYETIACGGGGQLCVMRWLRKEKKVPWDNDIFKISALEGNLDILKFLHEERCPWPQNDYLRVRENWVKPGVVDWLRANGYSDRVYV